MNENRDFTNTNRNLNHNINDNYNEKIFINSDTLKWASYENKKNIHKKIFSLKDLQETSLLKLEKNSNLNNESKINSVEIFVLEGTYINEYGEFKKGTYAQFPKEDEKFVKSNDGCTIFRKTNYFDMKDIIVIDTNNTTWLNGHGNLMVMPLFEQTALVKWPQNERFISHKHWGGEEIFVLSGKFIDEHGSYPKNSWIRSPHLSHHLPYVEEETIIYVKTGHL